MEHYKKSCAEIERCLPDFMQDEGDFGNNIAFRRAYAEFVDLRDQVWSSFPLELDEDRANKPRADGSDLLTPNDAARLAFLWRNLWTLVQCGDTDPRVVAIHNKAMAKVKDSDDDEKMTLLESQAEANLDHMAVVAFVVTIDEAIADADEPEAFEPVAEFRDRLRSTLGLQAHGTADFARWPDVNQSFVVGKAKALLYGHFPPESQPWPRDVLVRALAIPVRVGTKRKAAVEQADRKHSKRKTWSPVGTKRKQELSRRSSKRLKAIEE